MAIPKTPAISLSWDITGVLTSNGWASQNTTELFFGVVLSDNADIVTLDNNTIDINTILPDHNVVDNGGDGVWHPELFILDQYVSDVNGGTDRISGKITMLTAGLEDHNFIIPVWGLYATMDLADTSFTIRLTMTNAIIQLSDAYNPVYIRPYRTVGY